MHDHPDFPSVLYTESIKRLANDSVSNKKKLSKHGRLTRCRHCFHQHENSRRILIQNLCPVRLKVRVTATVVFQC